ncbi:unnamed protein product [Gongylonema pulchrum]|uniref:Ferritin domain-containing protein n=1 Tax=Gongylonema pulchrum TaxID=637853 RepID=A0A183EN52_9BILA|nr:unnamed protein product [Gongylonema pulchrum]
MKSTIEYFHQFAPVVESRLAAQKKPIEKHLSDYVKIMKYTDLNSWSVKSSAQKSHQQLFRLIKQFKASLLGNELVAPLFDELLPMPGVTVLRPIKCPYPHTETLSCTGPSESVTNAASEILTRLEVDAAKLEQIEKVTFELENILMHILKVLAIKH